MISKTLTAAAALIAGALIAGAALAQTAAQPSAAATASAEDWRTIAAETLLVIDTSKGRVLVELDPQVAPNHVERVRTLANQGFYDGLKFHRVIKDFMAQTGDPLGTGQGGSELPDIAAELTFRRGRSAGFTPIESREPGLRGLIGEMPVVTQPDAQMFVTADQKVSAYGLFCPGVVGMARSTGLDSANSQFFLMSGRNDVLDEAYTPFGRVVAGLDVVRALKVGDRADDGAVKDNPDTMVHVRTADALPEAERPTVQVLSTSSAAFAAEVAQIRADKGSGFTVCDVQPTVQVAGG